MSDIERMRLEAVRAAARVHGRLGTEFTRRVEIFDIIEQEQIWLLFEPLPNLYGLYRKENDTAGIIINSQHPLSLQRFTAAHEYGHHVLGHEISLDGEENIEPSSSLLDLREVGAQTFAGYFLMPLGLVNHFLRRMGLPLESPKVTAFQAYRLSLDLGISYAVLVTHLATIRKISWPRARELRRLTPREIKREIGGGMGPQDSWADLWPIEPGDAGLILWPRVNDELRVRLPETPSSGYIWVLDDPLVADLREGRSKPLSSPESPYLALISDQFQSSAGDRSGTVGGGGTRQFVFRALQPGSHTLRLSKQRPWQRSAAPLEVYQVQLSILSRPTGASEAGPREGIQTSLLAA
jgi:Zn-dependent peptidase ImmA (M78 family)/predicted secreted protein